MDSGSTGSEGDKQLAEARRGFAEFLAGRDRIYTFIVNSPLEQRIRTIYSVIFPGARLWAFYLRFGLARLAQAADWSAIKVLLYKLIGVRIGRGAFISPDVIIDPHFPELIEIGEYAVLGWGAKIFTHECFADTYRAGRVSIGRGANIGAFTVVRGGVRIGERAEVGAMSVIVRDVPDGGRHIERGYIKARSGAGHAES